ncbi:MAG TPA: 6,7-dimethyl-8-ribityllumazine synthase [Actinobacteria bacterium]|nr:6,7-dimethyl-8-ribityllumazine synthase [Actinomycetota bacterium]
MKTYKGKLIATNLKFGIVVSRFNDFLSAKLLDGALDALKRHGAKEDDIDIAWTPGSYELPLIIKKMAGNGRYNALISLGVIIRGDTPHFEYVANEAAKGIAKVSLDSGTPIAFGVITSDDLEQAIERAGAKSGNKGWQAALSAIEMANLVKEIH